MRSSVNKGMKVPKMMLDVMEGLGLGDEIASIVRSIPMDLPAYDKLLDQLDEMSDDTSLPTHMFVTLARQIRQIKAARQKRLALRVDPEDMKWELKPATVTGAGINYLHASMLHMLGYKNEADGLLHGALPSEKKSAEMFQSVDDFLQKGVVSRADSKGLLNKLKTAVPEG